MEVIDLGANVVDAAKDRDIIDLYLSGASLKEIREVVGVCNTTIYRALKRNGIKPIHRGIPMPEGVREAYEGGESVLSIAKRLGVERLVVGRWFRENGIKSRGWSEAGKVRASKMTPDERAAQAVAAHAAARNRIVPIEEKVARANARERLAAEGRKKMSATEARLLSALQIVGISATREKAIGGYNVDFAIDGILAVEVLGGSWHGVKDRRIKEAARANYILDNGWSIVFVWDITKFRMDESSCAKKILSILNELRRNPPSHGEYWVIGGYGQVASFGSDDLDETTLIVPNKSSFDSVA